MLDQLRAEPDQEGAGRVGEEADRLVDGDRDHQRQQSRDRNESHAPAAPDPGHDEMQGHEQDQVLGGEDGEGDRDTGRGGAAVQSQKELSVQIAQQEAPIDAGANRAKDDAYMKTRAMMMDGFAGSRPRTAGL